MLGNELWLAVCKACILPQSDSCSPMCQFQKELSFQSHSMLMLKNCSCQLLTSLRAGMKLFHQSFKRDGNVSCWLMLPMVGIWITNSTLSLKPHSVDSSELAEWIEGKQGMLMSGPHLPLLTPCASKKRKHICFPKQVFTNSWWKH